ncbi:sensor histidine kinase [Streptomyces bambusae]|uniref:sensor histidine kinase n=1 Tax=Streptomyces bambusae TaxID=1550616 RepID=UPI001C934B6A|nr:sensor histidine kinase [Streptomyces bambusae]
MYASRPAPWTAPLLYGAVLVAGGYAALSGRGPDGDLHQNQAGGRLGAFVATMVLLFALDLFEYRRYPTRTPAGPAVVLLCVRLGLFVAVAATDGSGLSRVLFVLVPFTAYFAFGRRAAGALALGCVGLAVATTPHSYPDPERFSDLLMFVVGLVLALAMAAAAVEEHRLRARLEASHDQVARLSAAAERGRVARDIHDGLGHHLTAVVVQLEKATAFRERDPEAARRAVEDARRSARQALADVRTSVRALDAEPFRLRPALEDLVARQDEIVLRWDGEESGHGEAALTVLYRVAQEGITNARRHAGASRIEVTVLLDPAQARLTVADDGRGFARRAEGFGLRGMRERVRAVGGRLEIDSGGGAGTRLTVTVPQRQRQGEPS